MRKTLGILFLMLVVRFTTGQPTTVNNGTYELEKEVYSTYLKFNIDTMHNPLLYKTAIEWLKTRYQYGGKNNKGIDCSDFSALLYDKAYGVKISGSSADLCNKAERVKKEDLKEGDLVFFKIQKNRVSHVGVYLTNNKFAHATTQAGVIVSDLNEPYYRKYYYSAGRIIK